MNARPGEGDLSDEEPRDPGRLGRRWLVAAFVLLAGWAAWSLTAHLRRRDHPPMTATPAATMTDPAFDQIYLKDVSQSAYDGGEKLWSLSAEEIVHRKRKIGPLTLNPVKEIEMTGVRMEIDRPRQAAVDGDADLPIGSILEQTLTAKNLGFVSRVQVKRIAMRLLRGGEPIFSLEAGSALVGAEGGVIRFKDGVTLTGPAVGRLEAPEMEWRAANRRLLVRPASGHGDTLTFRIDAERGPVKD